jgi:hypothetical protein
MNIKDILLIIFIIYFIISYNKNKNIEKFALSDTDKNEMINLIRPAIKEIYNTDMSAVRNLDKMAQDLTTGALKVPGNLTVEGNINSTGTISGIGTAPIGSIIMWAGRSVTLPSNWKFCDGTTYNGIPTPDLRGRFVLGANIHQDGATITSDTFNSRAYNGWNLYSTIEGGSWTITGGTKDAIVVSHSHGITDPGHFHSMADGGGSLGKGSSWYAATSGSGGIPNTESKKTGITKTDTEGSSGTNANLPPYYALAYIMRIA